MNKIAPRLGWIIGITLSLLPLVLWLPREPLSYYLADSIRITGTIAKIGSLTGTAMFAYSLILSARLKWVEWLFNGLDKLYKAHRFFGTYGFWLIMIHPLFLTLEYAQGFRGGLQELWLDPKLSLQLGRIAFLAMALVLILTVLRRVRHQTFIKIHRLLGVFFIFGVAHAFLMQGQLAVNPGLRAYTIALWGAGTAAFLYHSVLGSWLINRYLYQVMAIHDLGQGINEIVLKRLWRPISFTPGQFAFLSVKDPDVDREAHPFAITSRRDDSDVRMVIKNLGDYTAKIGLVDIGSQAYLEGPYGSFSYLNVNNHKQIWIAGGIGITPFLSMARNFRKNDSHQIDLFYCTKIPEEAVFLDELKRISKRQRNFRVHYICEATNGFLTADIVELQSGKLTDRDTLICGPQIMMRNLQRQLEARGVPETQIRFEEFAF